MSHHLEKIILNQFRNIENCELTFSPKINCLFGKNGNGKTNLLEAIFYSVFKKSFRKNVNKSQLIQEKKEFFIIKTLFSEEDKKIQHALKVSEKDSLIYVNNIKKNKLTIIPTLPINPYDAYLFNSQTSVRRDLFNHLISNINNNYYEALKKSQKALKMRNALLVKFRGPQCQLKTQLKGLDEILAENGIILLEEREKFVNNLNRYLPQLFNSLFNEPKKLYLKYDTELFEVKNSKEIYEFYQSRVDTDIQFRRTKKGLHLDDFTLFLEEKECNLYGSVGQQKISYLSLLFSYVEYLENTLKTSPILLLDDISGELDGECWKNLLVYLSNKDMQVFISTANNSFHEDLLLFEESKMFEVNHGVFTELNNESRRSST